MADTTAPVLSWHRVIGPDELPEGRVKTVSAGPHSFALTHFGGQYAALSNRCPHQGGPLGALDDALATAISHDGPALVEIVTDPELV